MCFIYLGFSLDYLGFNVAFNTVLTQVISRHVVLWAEATSTYSEESALFIYLGFYVAFNTVQVISRRVVGTAEETSTYSSLGFCTVNCRPMASNY